MNAGQKAGRSESTMALSERKKQILKAVIDDYVETAEPVGSKAVAARMNVPVSSATVRNEMADLENMGYLEQPHTSAGRIPSDLGYRIYVDELMDSYSLSSTELAQIQAALRFRMVELDRIIGEAGKMISEITHHTAIALTPTLEKEAVKRFELIPVDRNTVVLVLVTTSDQIKNKICHLNFPLSDFEIAAATRALNTYFTNIPFEQLTEDRIHTAEFGVGEEITEVLIAAIDFAASVISDMMTRDAYLEGATQILKYPEYHNVEKARQLLEYLSDHHTLTKLAPPGIDNSVKIIIGEENEDIELEHASVVMTSYDAGVGKGIIGVVGPTRMDYAKVSARLVKFAEGLSSYLNKRNEGKDSGGT